MKEILLNLDNQQSWLVKTILILILWEPAHVTFHAHVIIALTSINCILLV